MKDPSIQFYSEIIHQPGTPIKQPTLLARLSDLQKISHSHTGIIGHLGIDFNQISATAKRICSRKRDARRRLTEIFIYPYRT